LLNKGNDRKYSRILDSEIDKLKSEIKKTIKINAVNKHEWETFETNLNQIHNEFIIKLSKKYPNPLRILNYVSI
jgi:hypothetical protein